MKKVRTAEWSTVTDLISGSRNRVRVGTPVTTEDDSVLLLVILVANYNIKLVILNYFNEKKNLKVN